MTRTDTTATPRRDGLTYTAVLAAGADGWFLAQVPEVPEAVSQGRTAEEARANVEEALRLALAWRAAEGEPPPPPGGVTVSQVTVRQPYTDEEYDAARQRGSTPISLPTSGCAAPWPARTTR